MSAVLEENVSPRVVVDITGTRVYFSLLWHFLFFLLSGDKNKKLHGIFGKDQRIVQGVAILTKMGTVVSKVYPAFMVRTIREVTFKHAIYAGTTVEMYMEDFKWIKDGVLAEVTVRIRQDGKEMIKPIQLRLVMKE